jgi:hypothetical protein
MQALHAVARDAPAMDRYGVTRWWLAEGIGTDPGAELRTLHPGDTAWRTANHYHPTG